MNDINGKIFKSQKISFIECFSRIHNADCFYLETNKYIDIYKKSNSYNSDKMNEEVKSLLSSCDEILDKIKKTDDVFLLIFYN